MSSLTDDECKHAYTLHKETGNWAEVARILGVKRSTVQHRAKTWEDRLQKRGESPSEPEIRLPEFPPEHVPIEQVIAHMSAAYQKRAASYAAHTWFPVKVKHDLPIGVLWFGDPHVDDDGANWPLLEEHIALCRNTEGLYGANIGDTTNGWGGRLIRKYADQDTSLKTAQRLAEWFLLDSGIKWLIWLFGNHEHMADGGAILAQMAKRYGTTKIVMHDWEARFRFVFPSGAETKVYCAHNFEGSSMWNPLHGNVKAARFGSEIDLLVSGHLHTWGISQWELPDQGTAPVMIRVRGYKHHDDFARKLGFFDQKDGASILTIIDPKADRLRRVTAFVDVEAGADYLTWLRGRA